MKNAILFLVILSLYSSNSLSAQLGRETNGLDLALDQVKNYSRLMSNKGNNNQQLIGIPYLYEKWSRADVSFKKEVVKFDNVKIDLLKNHLEIKINGQEKILDKTFFSSFSIANPETGELVLFVNAEDYSSNGDKLVGFLQKLEIGEYEILTHNTARLASSGRSSISSTGGDTQRVVKKKKMYISKDGKAYKIKRKKDVYKVFSKNKKRLKKYMKDNKTNVKKEEDLVKLTLFYQS